MQPQWQPQLPAPAELTPGPAVGEGVSSIRAVKAVFEDANWKNNVLIGLLLMLIPIVGPIAFSGWMCEVQQRLVRRHPNPIAKLDFADFGELIKRGLPVFLTSLIITMPVLFLAYAFVGGSVFAAFAVAAATGEPLAAIAVGALLGIIAIVLSLLLGVVINAAHTRAELTEELGQALSFGKVMSYSKATAGQVIVKNFTFMFIAIGIMLLGALACYIGMYPAIAVIQIAAMHLRNQVYVDYLSKGGEPIEMKPPQVLPSEARLQQQPAGAWGAGY